METTASNPEPVPRGRGRGKSRGGLGKYLRARGRGRGRGRPAEFGKRLVLEDEEEIELEPDSEEAKEFQRKYSRRQLGTNADRYVEPEPQLNSDGERDLEPEVDLSSFLARQRLSPESDPSSSAPPPPDEDDDVDHSLAHLAVRPSDESRKGKVHQVQWDEDLEQLSREKAVADANRDLKERFRVQAAKQRFRPTGLAGEKERRQEKTYVDAPPLPTEQEKPQKPPKKEMEDFLDDLLG
ncbi:hypothetical protein JAAARDRAFT_141397 [Jaapia argillacea MUCL 33604]|uniref:Uncharacterized protein n=1 Tax=Jaapia argillacea MUCL 33604 TaxID=933084 RepID=A0A067PAC0_9AGAM|nr:hypothetical protein JAAARDRAFT_141397 [Jaapia argillacea MUCL 33604]